MNDIKLVICDIDNTLVVKHHTLTSRAKAVIEKLKKRNVYFGIASGRSLEEIRRIIKRWGFSDLDIIIALNGSILWDGIHKKEYNYYKLKREWIKEILTMMAQFKCNPVMYQNDQIICKKIDEIVKMSAKSAEMDAIEVEDISTFYKDDNAKIMFRVDPNDMKEIETYLKKHSSNRYQGFKTQSTLMEFSNKKVSKAYALKKFCDKNLIDINDVMAFGDTSNDNEMIEVSGIGVCMLNGSNDTKVIADIISDKVCDEDGWADFMETHYINAVGQDDER